MQITADNVRLLQHQSRMKAGGEVEHGILAWSLMVYFVSFFLKTKNSILKPINTDSNRDVSQASAFLGGEDNAHIC